MIALPERKRHDTEYPLTVKLSHSPDGEEVPRDLTDAVAVYFIMTNVETGVVKVNRALCDILDQVTNRGQVRYNWQAADVDTAGVFKCEWEILFTNGKKATWPSDDWAQQFILGDLDNI